MQKVKDSTGQNLDQREEGKKHTYICDLTSINYWGNSATLFLSNALPSEVFH